MHQRHYHYHHHHHHRHQTQIIIDIIIENIAMQFKTKIPNSSSYSSVAPIITQFFQQHYLEEYSIEKSDTTAKAEKLIKTPDSIAIFRGRSCKRKTLEEDSANIIHKIILLDITMCLNFIIYYIYLYLYRHRKSFRRKPSIVAININQNIKFYPSQDHKANQMVVTF